VAKGDLPGLRKDGGGPSARLDIIYIVHYPEVFPFGVQVDRARGPRPRRGLFLAFLRPSWGLATHAVGGGGLAGARSFSERRALRWWRGVVPVAWPEREASASAARCGGGAASSRWLGRSAKLQRAPRGAVVARRRPGGLAGARSFSERRAVRWWRGVVPVAWPEREASASAARCGGGAASSRWLGRSAKLQRAPRVAVATRLWRRALAEASRSEWRVAVVARPCPGGLFGARSFSERRAVRWWRGLGDARSLKLRGPSGALRWWRGLVPVAWSEREASASACGRHSRRRCGGIGSGPCRPGIGG
jgi:hypothetical protein